MKANQIPKIDSFTAASVRAVRDGKATEQQQQEFYRFVVIDLGMLQADAFADTDRDTAFALGRQFVARRVVDAADVPMGKLPQRQPAKTSK